MIELHLKAEFETRPPPFVVKLRVIDSGDVAKPTGSDALAQARSGQPGTYDCESAQCRFVVRARPGESIDGDVLLCVPSRGVAQRLFRRASRHNTLLLTERCDQICVMCSQPPKNTNDEWRFPLYERALLLADKNIMVGVSGGEPTLYKEALLGMIERVSTLRPDLGYHILSNGQHFETADQERLRTLHERVNIVWGIPLYSHREAVHDEIVGKKGAFPRVMRNLFLLGGTKARIELRTVITALNIFDLPELAAFIGKNIPFIGDWAIMGMEPMGYARANWQRLFFDHSLFPQPIVNALEISALKHIHVHLYNLPRCTMPAAYRGYCVDSISDWKKKYLPECAACMERDACPGFFEWYSPKVAWAGISPILGSLCTAQ
jgi:His-Xaa-Ser system radical SAM maturase HxsC